MSQAREFDVVIWGASGFTGRLVAEYLYKKYGVDQEVKWAMAGRNQTKLERVRDQVADREVPLILADSHDEASLLEMSGRTKVICTTVGPYGKYGSKLVAACVAQKTDYCDLCGEVPWMRQMIDQHHETARANGTKIVHTCGFDSIPSDMGVYFVQKEAMAQTGQPAQEINMRVRSFSGGVSGGTLASLSDSVEKAYKDKEQFRTLIDPYGLNPTDYRSGPDGRDLQAVVYDEASDGWIYPFIMAGINTKVVRRSNALAGFPYGRNFRYDEATMSGPGVSGRLKGIAAAVPLGIVAGAKPGSLLKKTIDAVLPKPGEGPSQSARENGYYNLRFYTTLADGSKALGKVTGDMDPGYGSTAKMMGEAAVCLAQDELPETAGVLTPAVAMGDALLHRLETNAGLTFDYQAD